MVTRTKSCQEEVLSLQNGPFNGCFIVCSTDRGSASSLDNFDRTAPSPLSDASLWDYKLAFEQVCGLFLPCTLSASSSHFPLLRSLSLGRGPATGLRLWHRNEQPCSTPPGPKPFLLVALCLVPVQLVIIFSFFAFGLPCPLSVVCPSRCSARPVPSDFFLGSGSG